MKKIFALLTLVFLFTTPAFAKTAELAELSFSDSALLPVLENFTVSKARTTKLNTVSGEKGYLVERDYTGLNGKKFHTVLIDSVATAGWNTKKIIGTRQDGIWGNGATFKSVTVLGFDANLEFHPQLGLSLAIRLPKSVLTIESKTATEDELLSFSSSLLRKIVQ